LSKVFLFRYEKAVSPLDGLQSLMEKSGFEAIIPAGKVVAIKLHMGELGNIRYIRPALARKVVDIVKARGGKPFLFDTVINYPYSRQTREGYLSTAAINGFTEATMGAPVTIADDDDEYRTVPVRERICGCRLNKIKVPSILLNSACMIVLSHAKGSGLAGFGATMKNLGMGCVSRETKREQHSTGRPQFDEESGCDGCGTCADECPADAITIVDGKPERELTECISCCHCHYICPLHCWVWPPGTKERFQVGLAHAASAVISGYPGKAAYINFIQDITPRCDCVPAPGLPIVQDVGIAFSLDPVALDRASLDLIDRSPVIPGATTAKPPDMLGKMSDTSSLIQLETAEKLNLGSMKYALVEV